MFHGIAPNSITLAALLLVVMEAAELSRVPLEQVAETLLQIDRVIGTDDDEGDDLEPKIVWPVN